MRNSELDVERAALRSKIRGLADAIEQCRAAIQADDMDLHLAPVLKHGTTLQLLGNELHNSLMTVALLGPFSSGKTLLLSALLDQIDANIDEDGVWTWTSRIMPSDTRPTTSKPLQVRRGASARFLIRNVDENSFTELEASSKELLRYLTDLSHSGREYSDNVAEAILELDNVDLPCTFLDLPGTQSTRPEDDQVIANGLSAADCFIFASPAGRTLDRDAVPQLEDLYEIYSATGKPVFFALTQIDNHMNRAGQDARYSWEITLAANNEILRSKFEPLGDSGKAFVGSGFMPIASPSRAKMAHLDRLGESDRLVQAEVRVGDPMQLRQALVAFLEKTAGPSRLRSIERQYSQIRSSIRSSLRKTLEALTGPIDELRSAVEQAERDSAALSVRLTEAEVELSQVLSTIIEFCFAPPCNISLEAYVQTHLRAMTKRWKSLDEEAVRNVELAVSGLVSEWARTAEESPLVRLARIEPSGLNSVVGLLRNATGDVNLTWGEVSSALDLADDAGSITVQLKPTRAKARPGSDLISPLRDAVTVGSGTAAMGAAAATVGTLVFIPVGAAIGAVMTYYAVRQRRATAAKRQQTQAELAKFVSDLRDDRIEMLRDALGARIEQMERAATLWSRMYLSEVRERTNLLKQQLEGQVPLTHTLETFASVLDEI